MKLRLMTASYAIMAVSCESSEVKQSELKRKDLIVARFTATGTKETHILTVIKGPAGGKEPSYNQADIYSGTGTRDLVLYAVHLNGLNIETVERKCQEYMSIRELMEIVSKDVWSDWVSCGRNGCNVELFYRYNEGLKLVQLEIDGSVNATVANGTMGYMWEGFPKDKSPKGNVFFPVQTQTQGSDLTLRYFPVASDITASHWTLVAFQGSITQAYVCGTYMYCYED